MTSSAAPATAIPAIRPSEDSRLASATVPPIAPQSSAPKNVAHRPYSPEPNGGAPNAPFCAATSSMSTARNANATSPPATRQARA